MSDVSSEIFLRCIACLSRSTLRFLILRRTHTRTNLHLASIIVSRDQKLRNPVFVDRVECLMNMLKRWRLILGITHRTRRIIGVLSLYILKYPTSYMYLIMLQECGLYCSPFMQRRFMLRVLARPLAHVTRES